MGSRLDWGVADVALWAIADQIDYHQGNTHVSTHCSA